MAYKVAYAGGQMTAEIVEDKSHAMVTLTHRRFPGITLVPEPDEPTLRAISVFVNAPPEVADIGVCVNGEWWRKP